VRVFSDFERIIIEELIKGYKKDNYVNCLNNLLTLRADIQPQGYFLTNNHHGGLSQVFTYTTDEQIEIDFGSSINSFIMSLIELFEYLEQNKLIILVPLTLETGETSLGREKEADLKRFDSLPDSFRKRLYPFAASEIFISQTLMNHVNNQYKSSEDLRHEEEMDKLSDQLAHTKKAFWFSFSGLLLSVIISAVSVGVNIWGKTTVKVEQKPSDQMPSELLIISKTLKDISSKHNDISQSLMEISTDQKKVSENLERIGPFHNIQGE
jgi:hypothetical protein